MNDTHFTSTSQQPVGLCWYRRKHYARIRALMIDSDRFPHSYDAWLTAAEAAEAGYHRERRIVYRIVIDPDIFLTWCAAHNLYPGAQARTLYASLAAERLHDPDKL